MDKVLPSCKELKHILKSKRKKKERDPKQNAFNNKQFSIYEENIIYIVTLLMIESFHLQFDSSPAHLVKTTRKKGSRLDRIASGYEKSVLPLALEFYQHHVQASDLVLLNSLLSFNHAHRESPSESPTADYRHAEPPSPNQTMLILNYFPNLLEKYSDSCISMLKYDVQDKIDYYEQEVLAFKTKEHLDYSYKDCLRNEHSYECPAGKSYGVNSKVTQVFLDLDR